MTEAAFYQLLARYGHIVAKPIQKWGGQGIVFVADLGNRGYSVKAGKTVKIVTEKRAAWHEVRRRKASPSYIVQQYIPLAVADGRPFDIRVMVQRKKSSPWEVTGKLAKIAGRGWLVTNALRSHGSVVPVETALQRSSEALHAAKARIDADLDRVSLQIAERLSRSYAGLHVIGLDMGVDQNGKVWLIEANFTPMVGLFRKLKNRSMYRRIIAYRRS
jgi:glutathione synthase/RimK-type ligase-like ATP-grasp enzyme